MIALRFKKEPMTIAAAPFTMCKRRVPLVVVSTNVLSLMKAGGYSNGELPCCSPSATTPSRSPAVIEPDIDAPTEIHSATEATGMMHLAPLSSAAVMVDVARKMSMITTILSRVSYKCSNAGEKQTSNPGFSDVAMQ